MIRLSDAEIANLITELKPLPVNYRTQIKLKPKKGHYERDLDVMGVDGHEFRIIMRQSALNILDFSVILAYLPRQINELFILRRYNGRSHVHTNSIEEITFYGFHVHKATERYQDIGAKAASYAELCESYNNMQEALECMFHECGFVIPPSVPQIQGKLI